MVVGQILRRAKRGLTLPVLLALLALALLVALGSLHPQSPLKGSLSPGGWYDDDYAAADDDDLGPPGVWEVDELDAAPAPPPPPPPPPPPASPPSTADPKTKKGEHKIKKGFLQVDLSLPATQHPIRQLIAAGHDAWDAKQRAQSTSLQAAVKEYRRRHGGRNPPKGFDKWWKFVVCVRTRFAL